MIGGVLAGCLLLLAIGGTSARIAKQYGPPGPFDPEKQGLCDFHNGLYFPARAIVAGFSPYGGDYPLHYPVARPIPFYSPSVLLLHYPLAIMPLRAAEITFVAISYLLILAIGWFLTKVAREQGATLRWPTILWIAALIACSRGGHITIFNGYFTLELILATFVAIRYAPDQPWIAAMALSLVAIKPTYILPLGFLLFARGNYRSLVYGAAVTAIVTFIPMTYVADSIGDGRLIAGWKDLIDHIVETQASHRAVPSERPSLSWTRIDALALVAKWGGHDPPSWIYFLTMIGLNLPAMWMLDRRRRFQLDDGLLGVTGLLIITSMLVSVYHQFYDAMLLTAPLVGLFAIAHWRRLPTWQWFGLATLLVLPMLNYSSASSVLSRLSSYPLLVQILTSVNAIVLLSVWIAAIACSRSNVSIVTIGKRIIAPE